MSQQPAPVEKETPGQRLVSVLLLGALKLVLQPALRSSMPVERQRRRARLLSFGTLAPRGVRFTAMSVGGVPGEWAAATRDARSGTAVLYLHAGGYCIGSPAAFRAVSGNLALRWRARVFAADYRLAPEHPFPAPVDDACAAYTGLLTAGYDPSNLVIAGDSAGGGLALATALRMRERGSPLPAALVLFSPWVDLQPDSPAPEPGCETGSRGDFLTRDWLDECARMYLAGHGAREPLASPLHADLTGLPPVLIQAGGDELLLGGCQRLLERLRAAGVDAGLTVYPRRWHIFQLHAGLLRDADRAFDETTRFVRSHVRR